MATAQPQARLGRPGTPGLCFAILEIIWESEIGNRSRQKTNEREGLFTASFVIQFCNWVSSMDWSAFGALVCLSHGSFWPVYFCWQRMLDPHARACNGVILGHDCRLETLWGHTMS